MALRIFLAISVIAGVLTFKVHNKGQAQLSVRQHLVELCEGNSGCVTDVDRYYDQCFEGSYRIQRAANTFDKASFLNCFNQSAGREHFTITAH